MRLDRRPAGQYSVPDGRRPHVRRSPLVVAPLPGVGAGRAVSLSSRTTTRTHLRPHRGGFFMRAKWHFDIAADLDTPVSAYLKLRRSGRDSCSKASRGRAARRYSFIGFGDCLEVKLDAAGLALDGSGCPAPATQRGAARAFCARRSRAAPRPQPGHAPACRSPAASSATRAYDLVRCFERLPSRARAGDVDARCCTTRAASLLVFDHLTRGVALLHAGSEPSARRCASEVDRARCAAALPGRVAQARFRRPPTREPVERDEFRQRVRAARRNTSPRATCTSSCCRSASRAAASSTRSRSIARCAASIPRPTCTSASSGDVVGRRLLARGAGQAERRARGTAADRRHAAARPTTARTTSRCERELLADPKENAEHVMLVDLARNDLGRVAQCGLACASSRTARSSATAT